MRVIGRERLVRRAWLSGCLSVSLLAAVRCADPSASHAVDGLDYVMRGEADPRVALPLLVLLHGRGGDPERFVAHFGALTRHARLLALRAPIRERDGAAWFTFGPPGSTPPAERLRALVPRVMTTLRAFEARYRVQGRPVLAGFSQGAMLVYQLAFSEPRSFGSGFPIAGALLSTLPGRLPAEFPRLAVFHGDHDEVIPLAAATQAVTTLHALGADATLTQIPGATHWINADLGRALREPMTAALLRERARITVR